MNQRVNLFLQDTPKEKKKNKVSLKAKRESMKAQENGQVAAGITLDTEL